MNLTNLKDFRQYWEGKKFECVHTGKVREIPSGIFFHDVISIGQGYVDVGDGIVARLCGVREVTLGGLTKRTYDKDLT